MGYEYEALKAKIENVEDVLAVTGVARRYYRGGPIDPSFLLLKMDERLNRLVDYLGLEEKKIPEVPSVPAKTILVKKPKRSGGTE